MTFEEKLKESVQNFNNIDKPDYTKSDFNNYADFIELTALFTKEDGVSYGDIQDRFFGENNNETAEKKDNEEALLNSIFLIIQERILLYGSDYPFEYEMDGKQLKLKVNFSFKNKLYLSLLISSKLNIFNKFTSDLTTDFEKISYTVLKAFLPQNAVVKEFGKNSQ